MHIIVHPGQAHEDEIMAVALLLGNEEDGRDTLIERREPTLEDLADPSIFCVDVGRQHIPSLNNFDHHQRGRNEKPENAASLVARHIKLDTSEFIWWDNFVLLDVSGPNAVAQKMGLERFPFSLQSGILSGLKNVFEANPNVLVPVLREIGKSLIKMSTDAKTESVAWRTSAEVQEVKGLNVIVWEKKLPGNWAGKIKNEFEKAHHITIAAAIMPDDRGDGWTLLRFNDHVSVDMNRLQGDIRAKFIHAGGFVAKTLSLPLQDAIDMLFLAIQ